tara:strand:+ start:149 stop:673 length:525 start_codon:yes stop_codon:yes gene_type:complete
MNVRKIYTQKINNDLLNSIILLKKSHWNFSYASQLSWFKKNSFKNDIHFLFFLKKELIGYVHLGKRTYFTTSEKKITIKSKYILFRSLIINKKYQNTGIGSKIMLSVNNYLKKIKKRSFLICKKKVINFYKKNSWLIIQKKYFKIIDHKHNMYGMIFHNKNNLSDKKYYFHYNK